MAVYANQDQWAGSGAPWYEGSLFNIGSGTDRRPIALKIQAGDGVYSGTGAVTSHGEGPFGQERERASQQALAEA
jgi:hypothetical protein